MKKHRPTKEKRARGTVLTTIINNMAELEGKDIDQISKILGYDNPNTADRTLKRWRANRRIGFEKKDGIYTNFQVLDVEAITAEEEEQESLAQLGLYLKSRDRYRVIKSEFSIAADQTAKLETRQKANTNILRALEKIPNYLYAQLYLEENSKGGTPSDY